MCPTCLLDTPDNLLDEIVDVLASQVRKQRSAAMRERLRSMVKGGRP